MKYQGDKKVKRNLRKIELTGIVLAGVCALGGAAKAVHDWPEKQVQYERSGVVVTIENPAYGLEQRISFMEGIVGFGIGVIIAGSGIVIQELYKDYSEERFSVPNYT